MSRYSHRTATCGNVTLNSSRKDRSTLKYWFFINMGRASCGRDWWLEFDVRELAKLACCEPPKLATLDELAACGESPDAYEKLLQRDLDRVAIFCHRVDAVTLLRDYTPGMTYRTAPGDSDLPF